MGNIKINIMGIRGLSSFIRREFHESIETGGLIDLKNKVVVFDLPCLAYRFWYGASTAKGVDYRNVDVAVKNFLATMTQNGIKAIYVSEGHAPELKLDTIKKRGVMREQLLKKSLNSTMLLKCYENTGVLSEPLLNEWSEIHRHNRSFKSKRKKSTHNSTDDYYEDDYFDVDVDDDNTSGDEDDEFDDEDGNVVGRTLYDANTPTALPFNKKLYQRIIRARSIRAHVNNQIDFNYVTAALKKYGGHVVSSSTEAETTCGAMINMGLADVAYSRDYDMLAYRSVTRMIFSMSIYRKSFSCVNVEKLLGLMQLTRDEFIDFCILCGTDYNKPLANMNPQVVYELISKHSTIENVLNAKNLYGNIDQLNHEWIRDLFNNKNMVELTRHIPWTLFCT